MYTRLVLGFHRDVQVVVTGTNPFTDGVLGLGGKIAAVEVKQVIVLYPGHRRATAAQIPYGLEQAAGDQPGIGQLQRRQALQDRPVELVP